MSLRVGMVGAGMVAEYHVRGWADCAEATLVGIADGDLTRARARAAMAPGAGAFASLDAMIASTTLDAVDIATPPETHASLVAEAQAAGLHVLCQKPVAQDAGQARAILAALRPETRVMVHENWRWRPHYRALHDALVTGKVARPTRFDLRVESAGLLVDADGRYPALVRQPFFATMPRFLVFEVLVHHLDTLAFLLGDIEVQEARLTRRCPEILGEDRAEIVMTAGGIPGRIVADFCVPAAAAIPGDRLCFDAGETAVLDGWSLRLPGQALHSWDRGEAYQASYSATIAHFAEALATGAPFETSVEVACAILEVVDRVYALARWS